MRIVVELDVVGGAAVRLDDADGVDERRGNRLGRGVGGGGGGDAGGEGEGGEGAVAGGGGEEDVGVGVVPLVEEDGAEEGAAGEVALPQDAPPVRRLVPLARVRSWLRLRLHRRRRRQRRRRHLLAVLAAAAGGCCVLLPE